MPGWILFQLRLLFRLLIIAHKRPSQNDKSYQKNKQTEKQQKILRKTTRTWLVKWGGGTTTAQPRRTCYLALSLYIYVASRFPKTLLRVNETFLQKKTASQTVTYSSSWDSEQTQPPQRQSPRLEQKKAFTSTKSSYQTNSLPNVTTLLRLWPTLLPPPTVSHLVQILQHLDLELGELDEVGVGQLGTERLQVWEVPWRQVVLLHHSAENLRQICEQQPPKKVECMYRRA